MYKVLEHLHAVHESLAHLVGRRHPCPAGVDPTRKDPPESGKQLQAAMIRYNALVASAPAAYQANAAQHVIHLEAALRLAEVLRDALPGFRPTKLDQLQEELERQATALEEDIHHPYTLLAAARKHAIKDFWRCNGQDIVQR